jgi:penicillin-binding protein 2
MMDPLDRHPPLSPQLAIRVATIGGFALVLFAIILFRLWYLQVLSGPQYVQLANTNRVRDIAIQAPRGDIVDRDGNKIVTSRQGLAVQIDQSEFPAGAAARAALYARLGGVLGMAPAKIRTIMHSKNNLPYANVTIKVDATEKAKVAIDENLNEFPGVKLTPVYLRAYKYGDLAAQVLGNVGPIDPGELKEARYKGVPDNGVVGQAGLEEEYDQFLRGKDGVQRVQVNSAGVPSGAPLKTTEPTPGRQLRLSIDLGLEQEGYKALQTGEGLAQSNGNSGDAGAFVALDPRNGQVLAMGSLPSFNPTVFTHPLTGAEYAKLVDAPNAPELDRAVNGEYPTGSTFKLVTAMAALEDGLTTPTTPFNDTGCITVGRDHEKFCNAGNPPEVLGSLTMPSAIAESSDLYFFTLGENANQQGPVIQSWARKFGFGSPTGIDLPSEFGGVIPDRAWLTNVEAEQYACLKKYGKVKGPQICGYIADPTRTWVTGDNMHFAIGQGDFLATPLQLAVAYSTLFENGRVPAPHLGLAIDDNDGRLIQKIDPPSPRTIKFDSGYQQVIEQGLRAAAQSPGGTSYDVFGNFPRAVYGKTGTAQHAVGSDDQAWYVAYAPSPTKPIVIALTIEKGGFGDQSAAPAVRLMLSKWFGLPLKVVAGSSQTL